MIDVLIAAALAAAGTQDHAHGSNAAHASGQSSARAGAMPGETGHATFAALEEIVALLEADPATDWTKVDIDALRAHLIDMDNVTLRAQATVERLADGARFRVAGSGDVVGSIQRMTTSHFTPENVPGGWTMASAPTAEGAIVTVTSPRPADVKRIQALGFFGILTLGMHHQAHHLMIARGMQH